MLEQFFPREYHAALKFLGNKHWINVDKTDNKYFIKLVDQITASQDDLRHYNDKDFDLARILIDHYCATSISALLFTQSVAKSIATGPKLFRPSYEQCLALENTEANVPFDFYQQPYPTVILELPKTYQDKIHEEFNIKAPQYVLCHRHETGLLAVTAWFDPDNVVVNIMCPIYESVEDAIIKNRYTDDIDFKVAELVQRLALNFCLMMTFLGTKVVGPLNPKAVQKQEQLAKSKNKHKSDRAKKFLVGTVYLCEFQQEIKFFDSEQNNEERIEGEGQSHPSPKPHWRKGHFRQQPYGPKNSLRRLCYIKPVMVMMRNFVGDLSDTSVRYTGGKHGT